MTNENVISTLNTLIETNKDGQEGFKVAAEDVQNSETKSAFYEYSQQRSKFVGELQTAVRELGGDPENAGSVTGAIHRGWINIKSAVTGQDDQAILNEAERGEDAAKAAYKSALEEELPANVRAIVERQSTAVEQAHDRVRAMRDSAKSANA